jgi:hypothetical protein
VATRFAHERADPLQQVAQGASTASVTQSVLRPLFLRSLSASISSSAQMRMRRIVTALTRRRCETRRERESRRVGHYRATHEYLGCLHGHIYTLLDARLLCMPIAQMGLPMRMCVLLPSASPLRLPTIF